NRKVVEALRSYREWSESLLASFETWPEPCGDVPLSEAADRLAMRSKTFAGLAKRIQELGFQTVRVPLSRICAEAERQLKIRRLESKIASHPVLAALGEHVWLSPTGCDALRDSAELVRTIAIASPESKVRARLFSAEAAAFRRALGMTT